MFSTDNMYNIKVISDVHLEMYDDYPDISNFIAINDTSAHIDIICLCGDIGDPNKSEYERFLRDCAQYATIVVLVILGNHEMYGKHPYDTAKMVEDIVARIGDKVKLLNNTSYDVGNYRFLGTTLWSEIDTRYAWDIRTRLSDFHRIKDWNIGSYIETYNMNMLWLRIECDMADVDEKKLVIMSHHAPLMSVGHPKHMQSCLKSAFSSDLYEFIARRSHLIKYWFYGHDHYSTTTKVNETVVTSNQVGYNSSEDTKFDPALILVLE